MFCCYMWIMLSSTVRRPSALFLLPTETHLHRRYPPSNPDVCAASMSHLLALIPVRRAPGSVRMMPRVSHPPLLCFPRPHGGFADYSARILSPVSKAWAPTAADTPIFRDNMRPYLTRIGSPGAVLTYCCFSRSDHHERKSLNN